VTDAFAAGRRVFVIEATTVNSGGGGNGGRGPGVARLALRERFVTRVVGGWEETPEDRLRAKRKAAAVGHAAKGGRAEDGTVMWLLVELRPPEPLALPSRRGRHRPT
jgi:hypothetical protein